MPKFPSLMAEKLHSIFREDDKLFWEELTKLKSGRPTDDDFKAFANRWLIFPDDKLSMASSPIKAYISKPTVRTFILGMVELVPDGFIIHMRYRPTNEDMRELKKVIDKMGEEHGISKKRATPPDHPKLLYAIFRERMKDDFSWSKCYKRWLDGELEFFENETQPSWEKPSDMKEYYYTHYPKSSDD